MFEYDKYIEPLDPPSEVIFSIQKNQWLNSGEDMNIQKTWKGSGLFWMGLRYTNQMESMRVHNKQIPPPHPPNQPQGANYRGEEEGFFL